MSSKPRYEMPIFIGGLLVVLGALCLLQSADAGLLHDIVHIIWPLSLIAAGVYGILLHNWREKDRQDERQLR